MTWGYVRVLTGWEDRTGSATYHKMYSVLCGWHSHGCFQILTWNILKLVLKAKFNYSLNKPKKLTWTQKIESRVHRKMTNDKSPNLESVCKGRVLGASFSLVITSSCTGNLIPSWPGKWKARRMALRLSSYHLVVLVRCLHVELAQLCHNHKIMLLL